MLSEQERKLKNEKQNRRSMIRSLYKKAVDNSEFFVSLPHVMDYSFFIDKLIEHGIESKIKVIEALEIAYAYDLKIYRYFPEFEYKRLETSINHLKAIGYLTEEERNRFWYSLIVTGEVCDI